jgi:hypothetical protein
VDVGVAHIITAVIDTLAAEVMIHPEIVVVIHHVLMNGKIFNQMKIISMLFFFV